MEFFIDKIFNGGSDNLVHLQFQRFSRGEFKNRAMVVAKSGKRIRIGTTHEYGNEFVRYFTNKLGNDITNVTGVIISTRDLRGELEFIDKKQFMGVKKYVIDKEMSGMEILKLCDDLPHSFLAYFGHL